LKSASIPVVFRPQLGNDPKSTTGAEIVWVKRNGWEMKCEGYGEKLDDKLTVSY
jgi:hypothetical protein